MQKVSLKVRFVGIIAILAIVLGLLGFVNYVPIKNLKAVQQIANSQLTQNTQNLSFLETKNLIKEPEFPIEISNKSQISLSPNNSLQYIGSIHDKDDLEKDLTRIINPERIISPSSSANFAKQSPSPLQTQSTSLIGFTASTLANDSVDVDVNVEFTVTIPVIPPSEITNVLGFYPKADFTISRNGNLVTVKANRLQRSTQYTFGLKNQGICIKSCSSDAGTWYYALNFSTIYKEVYVYGKSVQNRDLVAYLYGNADKNGKSIMLTGGIHGEEWRSGGLTQMVSYLDANPNEIIGQNKEIIIVPRANPDGAQRNIDDVAATGNLFSSVGRHNARNVNLNRNWPDVWLPCSTCGAFEASEPEVFNLKNLTLGENVTHLISYHAQWPPNGILFLGSDTSFAPTYNFATWVSQRSGFPIGVFDGPGSVDDLGYVPGDQSVWGEFNNIRSLIIEATYRPNSDYNSGTLEARLGAPNNYPLFLALLRDF
ncbi:MAG: M14 family zinc carboxypeptidase [bacterium]